MGAYEFPGPFFFDIFMSQLIKHTGFTFNILGDFLRSHNFHTPYAIKVLEPVKQQNLQKLRNSDN